MTGRTMVTAGNNGNQCQTEMAALFSDSKPDTYISCKVTVLKTATIP